MFDKVLNFDFAVQHQIQYSWIVARWAAPIAERPGMEGHQIRKPHLDLIHGKANNAERGTMTQQAISRSLTSGSTGAFKDEPLGLA